MLGEKLLQNIQCKKSKEDELHWKPFIDKYGDDYQNCDMIAPGKVLTHRGLMMPNGKIDLGLHWLR